MRENFSTISLLESVFKYRFERGRAAGCVAGKNKKGREGGKGSLFLSFQLPLPFPSPICTSNTRAVVARNGCSNQEPIDGLLS